MSRFLDHATYAAWNIDLWRLQKKIPIRLFTYSESILESIASSRQIERKLLQEILNVDSEMKDKELNKAVCIQDEIKMQNIRNRGEVVKDDKSEKMWDS